MNAPLILGAVGTLVGLVRAVPQLVMLLRRREAFGVSVDTAGTSSIVSFGWVAYGLLTQQFAVSFATGASGVVFGAIAAAALRFGRQWREFRITPVWCVVLALSGLLAGEKGLGVVLPISVLAANIPQLRVAYREQNLADLSLGTWVLSVTDGLVWGTYSLIRHDTSIMAYGLFQVMTSGSIVVLKLAHGARSGAR